MRQLNKWLMHDGQEELFEILFACALNLLFLALIVLLLWPLGRPLLAIRLAKAYGILWIHLRSCSLGQSHPTFFSG